MLRIKNLKIAYDNNDILGKLAKTLRIKTTDIINYKIIKKSLDCRHKPDIYYVYTIDINTPLEKNILKRNKDSNIFIAPKEEYILPDKIKNNKKIIVVGSGPAGIYCAYLLAIAGLNPIIIERGSKIEKREKIVNEFWKTGKLDLNTNVHFGEGGAGTFSDGKLNTQVQDKEFRQKFILETFVDCGAPEEILYLNKPHIGTDILRSVVINMRKKIENLGGKYLFETCLKDIEIENGQVVGIIVNDGEKMACDDLILATGHSARDTYYMLHKRNIMMENKSFAVGLRIMHPQEIINDNQYNLQDKLLPAADYKLTYQTKEKRGVYTFCMCPGGYVVNASSENDKLVINGMSYHKRDSGFANSAVIATVSEKDFGTELFAGLKFQEEIEMKAYQLGQGKILAQRFNDYVLGKVSDILPSNLKVKGEYINADLNQVYPEFINRALKEGINYFESKIKGFASSNPIILGVETRTSSPLRILRNDYTSNILGIYPCGEGAGYAGGITSAAIDGMKVAEAIIEKYRGEL